MRERQRLERQDTEEMLRLKSTVSACIMSVGCLSPLQWQARTWTQLPVETGGNLTAQLDKN